VNERNVAFARRCIAEALGTALLVGIGTGAIVAGARVGGISQALLAFCWFLAVTIPVVLFVTWSGAHLNPAVTLSLTLTRRIDPRESIGYIPSQLLGAFAGSSAVLLFLGNYANLGATVPTQGEFVWAMMGEAFFTAVLVGAVFYLADFGLGRGRWRLLLPGIVVGISTYVIGPVSGSSLNPARSIAPAVLSGVYTDLGFYILITLFAAAAVAAVWKPRSVDLLDRGPGRASASR
jgi:aquaporin Z